MLIWLIGKKGLLAQAFAHFFQQKGLTFFQTGQKEVDITDASSVEKIIKEKKTTHIFNCAAFTNVDLAEKEKEKAFAINVTAPKFLAKYSKAFGAKLLHFSTDYVFDGNKSSFYEENDKVNPVNFYGKTKLQGEEEVQKENSESLILRTAWLFGFGKSGFFQAILENLKTQKEIKVIENKAGSPTFCKDLCELSFFLLDKPGIYHVVNKGVASRYELAKFMLQFLQKKGIGKNWKVLAAPSSAFANRAPRPTFTPLSTQKLEEAIKKVPRKWEQALEEYLQQETFL